MRITVKLFAIVRDRAGTMIQNKFPPLTEILKRVAYAVNRSYVPATTQLQDGDEVAIIPPVSGG